MMVIEQLSAVRIAAPSPLVGEGIAAGRAKLVWVRGLLTVSGMSRQPLTRLRFAKPPSPTRGEGKYRASGKRQEQPA
jgi:hypothetical protein